jgi:hypothetical protein
MDGYYGSSKSFGSRVQKKEQGQWRMMTLDGD